MSPRFLALGLWSAAFVLPACTVEGEGMMTTFGDPTNPTGGQPTTSATQTSGDTEPSTDSASTEGSGSESEGTSNATNDPTSESSGGPVDEQPEDGMYSECTSGVDCIGLTSCVTVPASPTGGFCSNTGCLNPAVDCDPLPGTTSNAVVECVDNGTGASVCAIGCSGGQTCPGGMECLALGASMVCA